MSARGSFRHCPPRRLAIVALLSCLVTGGSGQVFFRQTETARLIFLDREHSYVTPHIIRCFENSLRFHRQLFDYTPSEHVTILLQDFDDYGYAGATSIPINYMILGIEPFEYVYETSPTNERINWVMSHELAHVVASDKASKLDRFFRSIFFGKVSPTADHPLSMFYSYLTSPRKYSPRWYHEGIAVFLETWMSGGIGRVLGGYDEMVFRTMVRDGSYFYDVVGLESEGTTIDFQIGQNSYLYGTRFVTYLVYHYGPENLIRWFSRTEGSSRFFASQFKNVYGMSLDNEWSRWIEWEHAWQRANLDSIRKYPVTRQRPVSRTALGSVSRSFYDPERRKTYAAINYPGQLAHVAAIDIDTGVIEKVCDVPTPALYYVSATAYNPRTREFFFTTNNSSSWRDLNVVDLSSGRTRMLLKDCRTGDLTFNAVDESIWGVQHHNGISRLVRIPKPYTGWEELLRLDYGRDIFDLDISPDGSLLTASLIEVDGRQRLIRMEVDSLLAGLDSYDVLFEFQNNSPANFVFSSDGRSVYGTSYYTGVSNIFRYDFEKKSMDTITNCETGYFRPVPISNDSLIVFRYTGKGFLPVVIRVETREDVSAINYLGQQIVEKYPVVEEWNIGSPLKIDVDSVTTASGPYEALQHLDLVAAYPTVTGYKDYAALGMHAEVTDPLSVHTITADLSYSPAPNLADDERIHASVRYDFWRWKIHAAMNESDFYDLFGPTKTSRKGYSLGLQFEGYFIYDRPRIFSYGLSLSGYTGLERLPDYQNVSTSFDKFLNTRAKLRYQHVRRSLGAVEAEEGVTWELNAHSTLVRSRYYPRFFANLDVGFLLPIHHSSIWFRSSVGQGIGKRDEPFANFFFGGFGNNWVDYQDEHRYRHFYSFPGAEINDLGGRNYGKLLVEWTLPPLRFRRFGIPNLYCTWSRMALFSTGIITNVDSEQERRSVLNVGTQVDFRLVLFSRLDSTFSLGYAAAMEKDRRVTREFMFSLKIL